MIDLDRIDFSLAEPVEDYFYIGGSAREADLVLPRCYMDAASGCNFFISRDDTFNVVSGVPILRYLEKTYAFAGQDSRSPFNVEICKIKDKAIIDLLSTKSIFEFFNVSTYLEDRIYSDFIVFVAQNRLVVTKEYLDFLLDKRTIRSKVLRKLHKLLVLA